MTQSEGWGGQQSRRVIGYAHAFGIIGGAFGFGLLLVFGLNRLMRSLLFETTRGRGAASEMAFRFIVIYAPILMVLSGAFLLCARWLARGHVKRGKGVGRLAAYGVIVWTLSSAVHQVVEMDDYDRALQAQYSGFAPSRIFAIALIPLIVGTFCVPAIVFLRALTRSFSSSSRG